MAERSAARTRAFRMGARAEGRRFLRFLAVGGCCFVIETGALSAFVFWLGFDRVLAKGLAFVLAVSCTFLGNYLWVYPESRNKSMARQALQFGTVSLGGLAVNLLVFSSVDWFARDKLLPAGISLYVAHVAAVGTALVWNFIVNRLLTYNDVRFGQ